MFAQGDIQVDPIVAKTRVSSRPTHGPLVVCVYKYTDRAGDFYLQFVDKNVALYQIQFEHDVAPNSVTFDFKRRFTQFLKNQAGDDPTFPCTLED